MGSSPHTRGALVRERAPRSAQGIIPAYAGSTRALRCRLCHSRDHPRIRGEHLTCRRLRWFSPGSSPHTRGARAALQAAAVLRGIIPAYAGSTCGASTAASGTWDHPRIRGEHGGGLWVKRGSPGSSPHTRGALRLLCFVFIRSGIIPAYAGSTRGLVDAFSHGWDHPRIRGEHRQAGCHRNHAPGSSPHTRGALFIRIDLLVCCGIIPAYAGSTRHSILE